MAIQTIQFGDEGQVATREVLRRMEAVEAASPSTPAREALAAIRALSALDRQYGGSAPLPLEDVEGLLASALEPLARLEAEPGVPEVTVGVALWAIRHGVPLPAAEPVANALALRANATRDKAELSALVGLMHGVIGHVAPRLSADLERSNPERPWRILHANLAIAAIRTEDRRLMDLAFDTLDAGLPDEAQGFYGEALALALAPGIAPAVREALEARLSGTPSGASRSTGE